MQLIFIRHAQSQNNVIGETGVTAHEFEKRRSHDAELSDLGVAQSTELGEGVKRTLLKQLAPRMRQLPKTKTRVCLAISPMKRTLLTAQPVIKALEALNSEGSIHLPSVDVVPHIFENGGCYSEKDGIFIGKPGLTKSDMLTFIPTARIPDELHKGWWASSTRETEEELELRVTKTTEWIKSTACKDIHDVLIVVSHQDFSCRCIRNLLNVQGMTWLYNTSFSSFTLHPISNNGDTHGDSTLTQTHNCKVVIDYINSVDHLSLENIS